MRKKRAMRFLDGVVQLDHLKPENMLVKPWTRNLFSGQYEYFSYEAKNKEPYSCQCSRKLKIGLISTRFFGVPPNSYSGLEQIVWDLACALGNMGMRLHYLRRKEACRRPMGSLNEGIPSKRVKQIGSKRS